MKASAAIKIPGAIDFIEQAGRIVAETLQLVGRHVRPGISTFELDKLAEDYIISKGGRPAFKGHVVDNLAFPYSLCISVEDEIVHGLPSARVLREGEIVSVDCGVEKNGYYGDSAHTFAVGAIDAGRQKLLDVTKEALARGIEQAVSGHRVFHISGAVQRHVESAGFSVVRELSGHGIGRELHEEPSVPNFIPPMLLRARFPNLKLLSGQALAIEPMVNAGRREIVSAKDGWTYKTADGKPSAHFEHTVVVQDDKPLILTVAD